MTGSLWERQVEWFDHWTTTGPPVVVLEGFSGVGKSWLARRLLAVAEGPAVYVPVPLGSDSLEDSLLEIAGELQVAGINAMADRDDLNLRAGLEDALRQPCLIVLDDLQELLNHRTRLPPTEFLDLMRRIADRPGSRGRLLLITNESMPEGQWRDNVEVRRLPPPTDDVGTELLGQLLDAAARSGAVPPAQRADVVRWLGGNPRALQVLVGCLADDALEDLIKLEPELWQLKNEVASPRLVEQLEARFLARTLARLDSAGVVMLEMLSVYRRPFNKDAVERAIEVAGGREEVKYALVSRFILELNRNWYSLNPVARQLGAKKLTGSGTEATAYDRAATHYSRHFVARQVADPVSRAGDFVEARYHLVRSGRGEEFEALAGKYRRRLLGTYNTAASVPEDAARVEELIHLFASLLDDRSKGFSALRFFLARLLLTRSRRGDDIVALTQLRVAVADSRDPAVWILYMRLLAQVEGVAPMRAAASAAVSRLSKGSRLHVVYAEAKMLGSAGQFDLGYLGAEKELETYEAIATEVIPLVQLAMGLLLRDGRYAESVAFIKKILARCDPTVIGFNRLLEAGVFPALARRDATSIRELEFLIRESDNSEWMRTLCRVLAFQCDDRWEDALAVGQPNSGRYPALQAATAFSALICADLTRAEEIFHQRQMPSNAATEWLGGMIALAAGKDTMAAASLGRSLGRPLSAEELADPNLWIKAWDRVPAAIEHYPSFYFPRLPSKLTGLPGDLVRHETTGSALRPEMISALRLPLSATDQANVGEDGGVETTDLSSTTAPPIVIVNQLSPTFGAIDMRSGVDMGDTYNVGQAGAVGKHARSESATFNQIWTPASPEQREHLLTELREVRERLAQHATTVEETSALEALESAAASVEGDDYPAASGHLARAGRWALGAATSVGTGVAGAAIKAAIGI